MGRGQQLGAEGGPGCTSTVTLPAETTAEPTARAAAAAAAPALPAAACAPVAASHCESPPLLTLLHLVFVSSDCTARHIKNRRCTDESWSTSERRSLLQVK